MRLHRSGFPPHCDFPFDSPPGHQNRSGIPRIPRISFHSAATPPDRWPCSRWPPPVAVPDSRSPEIARSKQHSASALDWPVMPTVFAPGWLVTPIGAAKNSADSWPVADLAGCLRCYIVVAAGTLHYCIVGSAAPRRYKRMEPARADDATRKGRNSSCCCERLLQRLPRR